MKTAIIVQARTGSSRLPNKMFLELAGQPAIKWILQRVHKVKSDFKILATSDLREDDCLVEIAEKEGWSIVRGSLHDVLSRFAKGVNEFQLDVAVRLTGDCLLTDPRMVEFALNKFKETNPDYLILTGMIDGFDVEVISGKAILMAEKKALLPSEREHVTPYIRNHGSFKKVEIPYGKEDLSHIHLSLDYKEDQEVIESILLRFKNEDFKYEDVMRLIQEFPHIINKTKHIVPNIGYRISLEQDKDFIKKMKNKSS